MGAGNIFFEKGGCDPALGQRFFLHRKRLEDVIQQIAGPVQPYRK